VVRKFSPHRRASVEELFLEPRRVDQSYRKLMKEIVKRTWRRERSSFISAHESANMEQEVENYVFDMKCGSAPG